MNPKKSCQQTVFDLLTSAKMGLIIMALGVNKIFWF
jgi:hypothetical protein